MVIRDHVFRGERLCLYPECGRPETAHRESDRPAVEPLPHWFVGVRSCVGCGLRFNHPSHYFAPSRMRLVGPR